MTRDKAVIKLPLTELVPAAGLGLGSDRFMAAAASASGARLEETRGPAGEVPGVTTTTTTELLEEFKEAAGPTDEKRRDKFSIQPTTGRMSGANNGRSICYSTPRRGRKVC